MDESSRFFSFHDGSVDQENEEAYIGILDSVWSKGQLMNEISRSLKFPPYFGKNWDALHECLRDFHWIRKKKIILHHQFAPGMDDDEMKIYLEVLADSVEFWKEHPEHEFQVTFQIADRSKVLDIFSSIII